ncbi:putative fungal specific transcription factor domain-containing protein [Rosellinia necatrix]|uniref:Putative fungal specific transcription factor domain-containing protein n=1 Tax=Rosellinia necatrix TaxID=77044 RepID=A0A1W2TBP2_ROSNE|nr:putative fungal specific transcription factor domain-containing protein [Rosellinia necatrix]
MNASVVDTPSTMASSGRSPPLHAHDSPHVTTPQDRTHTPATNISPTGQPPLSSAPPPFITGPITLDPFATPSATLNPRSCVTCRRRKVRCDKHMPCGNCRKAQIQCVFPAPGRAPRRPRAKDPNAPPKQTSEREMELMKRLRKLEGIVEDLSGQIEFETYKHNTNSESPEATLDTHENERRKATASPQGENATLPNNHIPPGYSVPRRTGTGGSMTGSSPATTKGQQAGGDVNKDFGKLVLSEKGKVRYVSNAFWSKITEEIEALRSETQRLTDDSSDSSGDEGTPILAGPQTDQHAGHHGFIFGYSSSSADLRSLHPLPSQMLFYWQIYMENIDPIIKLLHVPAMTKIIKELRSDMSTITPGVEALMFAIYFAAITSMEADEVMTNFGAEKPQLIARYRFATEQALAKANCVTTSELIVLQAFVLFLILVRRYDDSKFSTALTGLVVKIAQSLGLHRDGTHFDNISPFDIEMRRRLWWAICVLDLRSAEDQGCELTVVERSFDTLFPLNVNDSDIGPEMTEFPPERTGSTDMTFCLIRYEICALSRRVHTAVTGMSPCPRESRGTLDEHEDKLLEMYEHIDQKYLRPCPAKETDLLNWVSATIARLIMSKMSLVIYQPLMPSTGTELPSDVRDRLFMASIEVVEYSRVLNSEPKIRHWRWLFQTYNQWHAVAYLLLEVCRRSWSPSVERGWIALNSTFENGKDMDFAKPVIWVMLRKLMIQAKRHRDSEIVRLRANPQAAEELDVEEHNQVPPASFQHLPSSVRSTLARDRWRRLVGTNVQDPPIPDLLAQHLARKNNNNNNNNNHNGSSTTVSEHTSSQSPQAQMPKDTPVHYSDLDSAMNEPYFSPQDLFPLAFGGDPTEFARLAIMGGGDALVASFKSPPSHQQQQQQQQQQPPRVPIETFNTRGGNALPTADGALRMGADVAGLGGGGGDSAMTDDHPPPWLWNPQAAATTTTTTPGGFGGYGGFSIIGGGTAADDQDVNMDAGDVVNWQNWMDSSLGINGVGFTGGI